MPVLTIAVTRIMPVHMNGQPNLKAFAEVKIGDITICDCRIIQQPGHKAYVTGPQVQVGKNFYPLVKMTPNLRDLVQATVIAEALKLGVIVPAPPAMPDNSQYRDQNLFAHTGLKPQGLPAKEEQ